MSPCEALGCVHFSCRLKNCEVVSSPQDVNEAIQDAVAFLQVPRPDLGILCSSRGAYAGELTTRSATFTTFPRLVSTTWKTRREGAHARSPVCGASLPSARSGVPQHSPPISGPPGSSPLLSFGPTLEADLAFLHLCRQAACA